MGTHVCDDTVIVLQGPGTLDRSVVILDGKTDADAYGTLELFACCAGKVRADVLQGTFCGENWTGSVRFPSTGVTCDVHGKAHLALPGVVCRAADGRWYARFMDKCALWYRPVGPSHLNKIHTAEFDEIATRHELAEIPVWVVVSMSGTDEDGAEWCTARPQCPLMRNVA
tara:strand:- start:6223 stop:6732 length:510 start_codon:yes stop_codon:yes gene_type:complete